MANNLTERELKLKEEELKKKAEEEAKKILNEKKQLDIQKKELDIQKKSIEELTEKTNNLMLENEKRYQDMSSDLNKKFEDFNNKIESINIEPIKDSKISMNDIDPNPLSLEKIKNKAREFDRILLSLNSEEQKEFIKNTFADYGLDYNQVNNIKTKAEAMMLQSLDGKETGFESSQFWNNLGWTVFTQTLSKIDSDFELSDIIKLEQVDGGKKIIWYSDYIDADTLKAYIVPDTYVKDLYQTKGTKQTQEAFRTSKDVHKGLLIPSISLNDITNVSSIFYALFSEVAYHITRPILKVYYSMRLKMIASPKQMEPTNEGEKIDVLKQKADFVIPYGLDKFQEAFIELKTIFDKLQTTSRTNMPKEWIPGDFSIPLEIKINLDDYVLICSTNFKNKLEVVVKAGTFNVEFLNLVPKFKALPYKETFEDYGGLTNLSDGKTERLFLVPKNRHSIIQMYEGVRAQPLLTFHEVIHAYSRYGYCFDKNYPIFSIDIPLITPTTK